MNRKQLEHAIRAACDVAEDREIYIIGSQSILGEYPDAPEALKQSMEVDAIPKNRPEAADLIDGSLGEGSMFHETFGFYVQGLDLTAAKLPNGWEGRCIHVDAGASSTGLCLEAHDLALSKLAAYREKDRDFVRTLLVERLVDGDELLKRLPTVPVDPPERKPIIADWIRATMRDLQ
jgi:hypothetical protein